MTLCYPGWINPTRTADSHPKRIICTSCCVHTVVRPDDEPRHARNMYRLTKYTKNMLCIKLVFLYTIISRCRSTKHKIYLNSSLNERCFGQQNTFVSFFLYKNDPVFEPLCKKYGSARRTTYDNTVGRMRFACWMIRATNTHSEYVILNSSPQQQRLRECAWMLLYTYSTLPVLSQPHMKFTSYDVSSVALQVCYAHIITTECAL